MSERQVAVEVLRRGADDDSVVQVCHDDFALLLVCEVKSPGTLSPMRRQLSTLVSEVFLRFFLFLK